MSPSPWEVALGAGLDELDPGLRGYFAAIPAGSVGLGSGVFERVGTPRRWLWPVLAVLAQDGILFPVWERDVPFTVVNRAAPDGLPAVLATRTFRFGRGDRDMVDEISFDGQLVDRLGRHRRLEVDLAPRVIDGMLELTSTAARVRFGRLAIRIPFAPTVRLTERADAKTGLQHVSLTLDLGVLGRIYEYSGSFTYRIEESA